MTKTNKKHFGHKWAKTTLPTSGNDGNPQLGDEIEPPALGGGLKRKHRESSSDSDFVPDERISKAAKQKPKANKRGRANARISDDSDDEYAKEEVSKPATSRPRRKKGRSAQGKVEQAASQTAQSNAKAVRPTTSSKPTHTFDPQYVRIRLRERGKNMEKMKKIEALEDKNKRLSHWCGEMVDGCDCQACRDLVTGRVDGDESR